MALGGGNFTVQNKELPGTYINFISAATASAALSDRGTATMPLVLDWGIGGEVFEVTNEEFVKNSLQIFGYAYHHDKLKGLRDLFLNATTLYAYRLNANGSKAENTFATAKYSGVRGNDLKVMIQADVDDESLFKVTLLLDCVIVDEQTVADASELRSNGYVEWKAESILEVTASTPLAGGTNGEVTGTSYQEYLDKIESYSFHCMGVDTAEETVKSLFAAFTKRMRDEQGVKFQTVLYQKAADHEGVINVRNKVTDAGYSEASLVYWVTGASAGCAVNKSNQNRVYDGEFVVSTDGTQADLKKAIKSGEFTLHKVGPDIRVLADINSLVNTTESKGEVFKENQTIRVIDQIGNDIAVLFNTKYLGTIPNNASGRISLWSDIVKLHEQMNDIGAIENFKDSDVVVEQGNTKKSVVVTDYVTVVNSMGQLYMSVTIA